MAQYETVKVSMHVSGITLETSEEELQALLERGKISITAMSTRLREQVTQIRQRRGL